MSENDNPILVYTTCPSMEVAESIGGELVERKLAACANILPGMRSVYVWEGKRRSDDEVVMLLKTRRARTGELMAELERLHPYETPAILLLSVETTSPAFAKWIVEETA
jgi:periplasmic divalent cation tolerance protein